MIYDYLSSLVPGWDSSKCVSYADPQSFLNRVKYQSPTVITNLITHLMLIVFLVSLPSFCPSVSLPSPMNCFAIIFLSEGQLLRELKLKTTCHLFCWSPRGRQTQLKSTSPGYRPGFKAQPNLYQLVICLYACYLPLSLLSLTFSFLLPLK